MKNSTSNLKRKGKKRIGKAKKAVAKPTKKVKLISQAAYARRKGVSAVAIHKHIKRGTITLTNGLVDPVKADRQLKINLDPGQRGKLLKTDQGDPRDISTRFIFNKAKAVEKGYQAKAAELSYKEKVGELVNAKEVEILAHNTYRKFRDQMLNVPDRIAAIVAGETDIKLCHDIILKEIEKGLKQTQNGCQVV